MPNSQIITVGDLYAAAGLQPYLEFAAQQHETLRLAAGRRLGTSTWMASNAVLASARGENCNVVLPSKLTAYFEEYVRRFRLVLPASPADGRIRYTANSVVPGAVAVGTVKRGPDGRTVPETIFDEMVWRQRLQRHLTGTVGRIEILDMCGERWCSATDYEGAELLRLPPAGVADLMVMRAPLTNRDLRVRKAVNSVFLEKLHHLLTARKLEEDRTHGSRGRLVVPGNAPGWPAELPPERPVQAALAMAERLRQAL